MCDLEDLAKRTDLLRLAIDGGEAAERIIMTFDRELAAGQRLRPNPEIPNRVDIFGIDLIDDVTAVIDFCRINSDIVYEPDGVGDGIELIVDDNVLVDRVNTTMKVENGIWKVLESQGLERFEGATACPAN